MQYADIRGGVLRGAPLAQMFVERFQASTRARLNAVRSVEFAEHFESDTPNARPILRREARQRIEISVAPLKSGRDSPRFPIGALVPCKSRARMAALFLDIAEINHVIKRRFRRREFGLEHRILRGVIA